ncbi:MAG: LysR family transcriptional regulator, partial [Paucibacter sp.]|nr:LysR family transcriptional regulator [Roseateles sp.]
MDQLRAMRVFVSVVDEHSFAGASRALDLAPAVVTRLVAELEEHLGARLLNRTTRRVTLTEIGEAYLERTRRILADVDEAHALTSAATNDARGNVRVLVPPALAVHQIAKHLPRFHRAYPQVTIELHSPGPVTSLDESYDLTIVHSREPLQGDFVARRLARSETIVVASPEYLERRGRPQHPSELSTHDSLLPMPSMLHEGIVFRRGGVGDDDGEPFVIHPGRGLLSTPNLDTNYAAALHGLGIAGLPSFQV